MNEKTPPSADIPPAADIPFSADTPSSPETPQPPEPIEPPTPTPGPLTILRLSCAFHILRLRLQFLASSLSCHILRLTYTLRRTILKLSITIPKIPARKPRPASPTAGLPQPTATPIPPDPSPNPPANPTEPPPPPAPSEPRPHRARLLHPVAAATLALLVAAFFLFDTPTRIRRTLKRNFGIGGPPVLRVETYRVQPQETLWAIAKRNNLSFDSLITINKLNNIHSLRPGQEILIPNQDGIMYKVKPGEDLRFIAEKFNVKLEDLIDVNDLSISGTTLRTNLELFIPGGRLSHEERLSLVGMSFTRPVAGPIRSPFGWRTDPLHGNRQFHTGIDFACAIGTPIRAAADGQVVFVGWKGGYGTTVILRHASGYTTLYAHLSRGAVVQGQFVKAGQVIAYSGDSGRTTGPHLHFEVRKYGIPKDPTGVVLTGGRTARR